MGRSRGPEWISIGKRRARLTISCRDHCLGPAAAAAVAARAVAAAVAVAAVAAARMPARPLAGPLIRVRPPCSHPLICLWNLTSSTCKSIINTLIIEFGLTLDLWW
jgi:hypothetical protein